MSKKPKPKAPASATEFTEALDKWAKRKLYRTLYTPPDLEGVIKAYEHGYMSYKDMRGYVDMAAKEDEPKPGFRRHAEIIKDEIVLTPDERAYLADALSGRGGSYRPVISTLHDSMVGESISEADMAKIPGDMSKARVSPKARDRAETLAEVMERVKEMGMDEDTRKIISDMLGTVRPSAPPRSGRSSFVEREREARLREEYARRIEAERREERRKAEAERAMRWEEEARLAREREEAERRLEEERERIRAIERKRARKQEVLREWQSILAEEAGETHDLKLETATVSVNPAKACVTVRCPFNATFAGQMCAIKGVSFVDGLFECTSEAMKQVKPLLAKTFKDVQMIGVPKVAPVTKFDALMAKLDKEDRSKIYKLLALKYHVDKGGRHDMMVLINQVFKES